MCTPFVDQQFCYVRLAAPLLDLVGRTVLSFCFTYSQEASLQCCARYMLGSATHFQLLILYIFFYIIHCAQNEVTPKFSSIQYNVTESYTILITLYSLLYVNNNKLYNLVSAVRNFKKLNLKTSISSMRANAHWLLNKLPLGLDSRR